MRSKCTGSTFGRKSVAESENGSSHIDFLYDVEIVPPESAFRLFWQFFTAHAQFQPYTTSGLKSDFIFEFSAAIIL